VAFSTVSSSTSRTKQTDGLDEVALLLAGGLLKESLEGSSHAGDADFRHLLGAVSSMDLDNALQARALTIPVETEGRDGQDEVFIFPQVEFSES
jgi:hypothetical protein